MIEPALIALIRDGETTMFIDPCGSACFARNLVWGQDALERWLDGREPVHEFDTECQAGAVIDFDAKALLWYTEDDAVDHPRTIQLLDVLIEKAWRGFEILYADGMSDLQIAAGDSISHASAKQIRLRDAMTDPLESRSESLEDEDSIEEPSDFDDESDPCAWLTILDEDNLIHHRLIGAIPSDVIRNERDPLTRLKSLQPHDVPAEQSVTEAIIFDQPSRAIRLWGLRSIRAVAKEMNDHWPNWSVECIESSGYEQQCRFSGPEGTPMTQQQALGRLLPVLLMTQRVDAELLLGEIGKSVKGFMAKLVGFLTLLFCLPFVIFAMISGNWKTGGLSIGIIVVLVMVGFKLLESKWRRGFAAKMAEARVDAGMPDASEPVVAGPLDPRERRGALDQLLEQAGMPSIAQIEPHFQSNFPGAL